MALEAMLWPVRYICVCRKGIDELYCGSARVVGFPGEKSVTVGDRRGRAAGADRALRRTQLREVVTINSCQSVERVSRASHCPELEGPPQCGHRLVPTGARCRRIDSGADARSALDDLLQKDARPQGPRRIKRAPAAQREPADLDPAPSVASPAADVVPGDTEAAPPPAPVTAFDSRPATHDVPSDGENWPTEGPQASVQVRMLFGEQPVAGKKPSYVAPRGEAAFHYPDPIPKSPPAPVRRRTISAAVVVLALIAGVEAGIIARLSRALWQSPQSTIVAEPTASVDGGVPVSSRSSQPGALQLTVAPDLKWVRVTSAPSAGVVGGKSTTPPTGTIRISSPIELKILEGSKVLAVPAVGLNVPAGRHDIELVNVALGYRLRQVLEVEAGQTLSIHVTPPPGSVTIDASPWAEVSIDGQAIGRTPLGPLPLSPGEHLVTFQHPAGGSDRQRITVKSEAKMRVVGVLRP